MKYIIAQIEDIGKVFDIVQDTIVAVYPRYYPMEVVRFFCQLHSKENIKKDILNHSMGILFVGDVAVGTGCYQENHITRVYVLPEYQGNGYGTYIMNELEKEISKNYNNTYLDASLPAIRLYEKLDYITKEHCSWEVENNAVLVYEVMEKEIGASKYWDKSELILHLDKLHTTGLGAERIKRNLLIEVKDVVKYCYNLISKENAVIERKGKNWYVSVENIKFTVNANSYTIITAHKES